MRSSVRASALAGTQGTAGLPFPAIRGIEKSFPSLLLIPTKCQHLLQMARFEYTMDLRSCRATPTSSGCFAAEWTRP